MSLLHYVEYGFVKFIADYVKNNPMEKSYRLAEKLGNFAYKVDKKHREIARDNLIRSFGNEKTPGEIEDIIRKNFINIGYNTIEFLSINKVDKKFIRENVVIEGIEHFEEALKESRGVINITGHLGNWELLGAIYTTLGFDLTVLAKNQSNKIVNEFIINHRGTKNINLISLKESNRKTLKTLCENHILGMIADQDAGGNGVFVNFFGRPASTARGPAVLQRKTGSPAIMSFLLREAPGKFRLVVEKPFNFVNTKNKDEDIMNNTMIWSNLLEMYVRKYPDQWFWVHRRWKTKKTGK